MSGIGVICFVGSYLIALAIEATRPLFRSGVRGAFLLAWAFAGFTAHTAFLYYSAITTTGHPIASQQGWFFVAAWVLVAAYLYLTIYHTKTSFGLFLLPLVLGLIAIGYFWADTTPFDEGEATRPWGMVHGLSLLLMAVLSTVGFVTGFMFLWQARRLKRKSLNSDRLKLPSLEWLQRVNERMLVLVTFLLGLGILAGIVLNRVEFAGSSDAVPWSDPVVLMASILFVWLVGWFAAGAVYRPIREGHRLAYQTVACFALVLAILATGVAIETRHWRSAEGAPPPSGDAQGEASP